MIRSRYASQTAREVVAPLEIAAAISVADENGVMVTARASSRWATNRADPTRNSRRVTIETFIGAKLRKPISSPLMVFCHGPFAPAIRGVEGIVYMQASAGP